MSAMRVTFWGVRGTFPATGAAFARYGGDTMCIEVECEGVRVVLDAGSGLRGLGAKLKQKASRTHIVLSHFHLDHILGLPHFAPFWREDACVLIHAPRECAVEEQHEAPFSILRPPLFPIHAGDLPAAIGLDEYAIGDDLNIGEGVRVRTFAVTHQGACAGVVVEHKGRKLCYITDHEHGDAAADARLAVAAESADLLIYDATFTEAEMPSRRGWGHSTWEAGVRLKEKSGARLLALAHHCPDRTDAELDALSARAAGCAEDVFFARQGMSLILKA